MFPVLRKKDNFNLDERKKKAKKFIEELMVLTGEEKEYLDMFEKGEYMPSLLISDNQILENIVHYSIMVLQDWSIWVQIWKICLWQ